MLEKITEPFANITRRFSGNARISEKNIREAVDEIKTALLDADVNLRIIRRLVNRTIEESLGESVLKSINPGQQFVKLVHDRILDLFGGQQEGLNLRGPDVVSVILMTGLQGSGKTTTAAKLAGQLKSKGRRVMMVGADKTRPAAVEQLEILGKQLEVPVFSENDKPEKIVKSAFKKAKKELFDTLIVDTAGRMQIDTGLMRELGRIKNSVTCDEILLVADAMTGQIAADIAKSFDEELGLTGVILSKFDSDTRGGAALSIKSVTGKPIKYIGVGEHISDLEIFYPDRMTSRILGMGDVVSLVEKAQETIEEEDAVKLQQKMASSSFTLEDYLDQIERMQKIGSVQKLMEMMPGMSGQIDPSQLNDMQWLKEKAIIQSMTLAERRNHRIIGPPRKKRIAKGSGSTIVAVNKLLKNFEKSRLMMKKFAKNKKMQQKMLSGMGNLNG